MADILADEPVRMICFREAEEISHRDFIEEAENSETRRKSSEEIQASTFASNVMLDNKASLLAEQCVAMARNSVERLTDATIAGASMPCDRPTHLPATI